MLLAIGFRLKELEKEGLDTTSSSSEEEDEDAALITPGVDKQILETMLR